MHILKNTSGVEDNFDIEDKISKIPSFKKRKVISKTINFVEGKIKENSTTKKEEKLKRTLESTKKTSIHFSDVVNQIGSIERSIQLKADQKESNYLEKQVDSNQEISEDTTDQKINIDLDVHNTQRETGFQNISTIEEELEDQETPHLEKEKIAAHETVPLTKSQQEESIVLGLTELDREKSSDNGDIQKLTKFTFPDVLSERPSFTTKIRIPISNNEKEKPVIIRNGLEEDVSKQKCCAPSENILMPTEISHTGLETTGVKQMNSAGTHTLRRYSPPSIKLEEYTARAKVNKLKIPDKFISEKELASKDLKNLINNSSKNQSSGLNVNNKLLPKAVKSLRTENDYATFIKNDDVNNNNNCLVDGRISNEMVNEDANEEEIIRESWKPNGSVKKLLQNYQQKPAVKQNNIRNLHGKIKPLPQDIGVKQEFCQLFQQRNIESKKPVSATLAPDRRIFPSSVKQEYKSFGNHLSKNISQSNPSDLHTSPICANHIVPEVGYEQMSVAKKRKVCSTTGFVQFVLIQGVPKFLPSIYIEN